MKWFIVFSCVTVLIAMNVFYVINHEMAHAQMAGYFDCEDVSIDYSIEWYGVRGKTLQGECNPKYAVERKVMHSLNEVVGYHAMVGYNLAILLTMVGLLTYIGVRRE